MSENKVVHFEIELKFNHKEQADKCVNYLLKEHINSHFSFEYRGDETVNTYIVYIYDYCWGDNLKHLGEFITTIEGYDGEETKHEK